MAKISDFGRGSIPGKIPNFKSKIPIPYLYLGRGKVEVVYLKIPREGSIHLTTLV